MSLFDTLAQSIATMEGYFTPGTLANSNNNPGNIRWGYDPSNGKGLPGQVGVDGNGFAIFSSPEAGWQELYRQLTLKANSGATVSSAISAWAPSSENDTSNYISFVSSNLGVSPNTPLNSLGSGNPLDPPKSPIHRKV